MTAQNEARDNWCVSRRATYARILTARENVASTSIESFLNSWIEVTRERLAPRTAERYVSIVINCHNPFEAAWQARTQMMQNHSQVEQGSTIIQSGNYFNHTPIYDGEEQNVDMLRDPSLPRLQNGDPDFSRIVGFVHSHPPDFTNRSLGAYELQSHFDKDNFFHDSNGNALFTGLMLFTLEDGAFSGQGYINGKPYTCSAGPYGIESC